MATATKPREIPADEPRQDAPDVPKPDPIHVLMGRILAELPPIGKTEWNDQQKFHFRGHDAVLVALNPLLAKHGVFCLPNVVERVTGLRTTSNGKTMYEVNLHVRFRFYGPLGDYVEASGWGEGTDMGDKATSKAMTMAFKYVVAQVFAISTQEGADADADRSAPEDTTRASRPAEKPKPLPYDDLMAKLGAWVGDPVPWAAEARKALLGDKTDLTEADRQDLFDRLSLAATSLAAVYPPPAGDGWPALNTDAGLAELQKTVRTAFSTAFGADVKGPTPFDPPVPFS